MVSSLFRSSLDLCAYFCMTCEQRDHDLMRTQCEVGPTDVGCVLNWAHALSVSLETLVQKERREKEQGSHLIPRTHDRISMNRRSYTVQQGLDILKHEHWSKTTLDIDLKRRRHVQCWCEENQTKTGSTGKKGSGARPRRPTIDLVSCATCKETDHQLSYDKY